MSARVQPPRKSKTAALAGIKADLAKDDSIYDDDSSTDEDFEPISREKSHSGTADLENVTDTEEDEEDSDTEDTDGFTKVQCNAQSHG